MRTFAPKSRDAPASRRAAPTDARAFHRTPALRGVKIGAVNDPAEREADRVADHVMRMPDAALVTKSAPAQGTIQRLCADCEDEIQRKADGGAAREAAAPAADSAIRALGVGAPLPASERAYFEPRFGRDFSNVLLHQDGAAGAAARSIGARAFTLGRDIAVAPGEYAPGTREGRRLLAHELTHVVQQAREPDATVRRITYGSEESQDFEDVTDDWDPVTLGEVPKAERSRVDEAIALVDEIVNDRESYSECHDHFASRCPNGTRKTLTDVWRRAVLWKVTSPAPNASAKGEVNGNNIAYTPAGYDEGAVELARSLLHEAGHNCGIGDATHWRAEQMAIYCIGGRATGLSLQLGRGLGRDQTLALFSYRRFLGELSSGRLRGTLGVDLSLSGLGGEAGKALGGVPAERRPASEFGAAIVGGQYRAGGWGGPRYGGLTFRVETGIGVGRFSLRPATPDDSPESVIAPAWVLQVGPRAEFLLKVGSHGLPLSFGLAYHYVQPLNFEAQALHGIVFSIEGRPR